MRYTNQLFSRYLDTDGDGTGTKNAIGNYADAGLGATDFYIAPTAEQKFHVARMIVTIEDASGFSAVEYASTAAALTNGVTITEQDTTGTIHDFTDGVPIKTNAEWGRLCYDVDLKTWSTGNEFLLVRYTFERSGKGLILDGAQGGKLVVTLNDDLSGLIEHYFLVQGYYLRYDTP